MSTSEGDHAVFFENENAPGVAVSDKEITVLKSLLDIVCECDNYPYYTTNPEAFNHFKDTHYHLLVKGHIQTLGLVKPDVAQIFQNLKDWELDESLHTLTLITGDDRASRTEAITATTTGMRATDHFQVLAKWRNERYPIYGEHGDVLFDMERSATPLFGVVTYGAHLTAYTRDAASGRIAGIWVPKRAATKQTYPSMLDNTVAGGVAVGETPLTAILREADEEASLPTSLVEPRVQTVGVVSYFHVRDARAGGETGLMQPEVQYVYDLELDEATVPRPHDDEVESFELMTPEAAKLALTQGKFKPNCSLVLVDFFVRHGLITPETERDYAEITARLHRLLPFPVARF